MADARRMGKTELFAHFAEKFDMKRTTARDFFEELLDFFEAVFGGGDLGVELGESGFELSFASLFASELSFPEVSVDWLSTGGALVG